jgi:hypothetical protein
VIERREAGEAVGTPARVAGGALLLASLLVLGYAASFVADDLTGALVLLLLYAVATVPVLGAALLSFEPAAAMLRGRRPEPRTPVLAGLLAAGGVGVAAVALRPGLDRALSSGDLAGGAVGGVAAMAALVALGLTLPGRPTAARVLLAVSGGAVLLALVALVAVTRAS